MEIHFDFTEVREGMGGPPLMVDPDRFCDDCGKNHEFEKCPKCGSWIDLGFGRLIVWRLDRLARSLKNLIEIAADLESRGVELVLITEGIDTTTPNGRLFFHIFGAVAEFERNLIIERTNAGLTAARSRGKFGGRRPVIDADKAAAIDALLAEAKRKKQIPSFGAIARSVGVSDRTVRRYANGQYAGQ